MENKVLNTKCLIDISIYTFILIVIIYVVGGFIKTTIVYDTLENDKLKETMLVNLKQLPVLNSEGIKNCEFNRYSRFSNKKLDMVLEIEYKQNDDKIIDYYLTKGKQNDWNIDIINNKKLVLLKDEKIRGKNGTMVFLLEKSSGLLWRIKMYYYPKR